MEANVPPGRCDISGKGMQAGDRSVPMVTARRAYSLTPNHSRTLKRTKSTSSQIGVRLVPFFELGSDCPNHPKEKLSVRGK